ncbi:hypothetical protein Tco_0887053 [Tanacetum coccineum]
MQWINSLYKDSDTKVDLRTNEYYFDHYTGSHVKERPRLLTKLKDTDFLYALEAFTAWSIRFSRFKVWFPSYTNKEEHRCRCVVFHSRDSCKFFHACKLSKLKPPARRKHNGSIIQGYYDKIKVVVKKVKITHDLKGTELKKKLRESGFHENLVAFLDWESDDEYNYYAYEGGATLADIQEHPYVEMGESSMNIIK